MSANGLNSAAGDGRFLTFALTGERIGIKMAIEIERKFLLVGDGWRTQASRAETMAQGYLAGPPAARCSVRVRIVGEHAFLTIKSATAGIARDEYEYTIALDDAQRMLATLAGAVVEKQRHYVEVDGHTFEIDEFPRRQCRSHRRRA